MTLDRGICKSKQVYEIAYNYCFFFITYFCIHEGKILDFRKFTNILIDLYVLECSENDFIIFRKRLSIL